MRTPLPRHVPLVVTTRGGIVECQHVGSIAVVDRSGRLIAGVGDPQQLNFTRSTLKPLQALPFVEAGGMSRYGFTSHELALMCASHNGETVHVGIVRSMLERIGATERDLRCGCHAPYFYGANDALVPLRSYNQLFHNCSGKHAGFLAYCRLFGHRLADYLDPDSPLQTRIHNAVRAFAGNDELAMGIDGCSAPNFALPLARLAHVYARLAADDTPELAALRYAMTQHPDLVSGMGRIDAALMRTGNGDWVTKVGADGMQTIGIRSKEIGIAIRIADGNARALHFATVNVLQQLGLLDANAFASHTQLAPFAKDALRNLRGTQIGTLQTAFQLPRLP